MAYFICPPEGSDLQIDIEDFVQNLGANWPDLEIEKPIPGPAANLYVVEWSITIDGDRQLGGIQANRQTTTIDDVPAEAVATFAIWYRKQIPSKYSLFLFHPSSDHEFELLPNTTEEDILNAMIDM